ncbi:probable endo-1,4-beta-xylanase B [Aspergillus lentulus]|nr:probable endo-1,4-beta-xylanase B [Aspergillus lentulus]
MSISSNKTKKASMIVIRLGLTVGDPHCVGATDRTQFYRINFRGKALITAITMASCLAVLLLGFDQGKPPFFLDANSS